jgi:hypothetical protein
MPLDLQLSKVFRRANQLNNVVITALSSKHYAGVKDI